MTDQDIELEHIYLEVKAERWHHIERFLFSYYCYKCGYVTKGGKPDWEEARRSVTRSAKFTQLSDSVLEPVVPLEVIIGEVKRYWRDGELTPATLQRIIDCLLDYVVIAKQELRALKKAGLQNAMPASWFQSNEREPLARFNATGILIQEQPVDQS